MAFDLALVGLCIIAAVALRTHPSFAPLWKAFQFYDFPPFMTWRRLYTGIVLFQALALPTALYAFRLYHIEPERKPARIWVQTALVVAAVHFAFIALAFLLIAETVPQGAAFADLCLLLATLPTWRAVRAIRARRRLARGEGVRNILIVGDSREAQDVAVEIVRDPTHGRRVVGFLNETPLALTDIPLEVFERSDVWSGFRMESASDLGRTATHAKSANGRTQTALKDVVVENVKGRNGHVLASVGDHSPEDMGRAIDGLFVQEVFLAPDLSAETMRSAVKACRLRGVDLHVIPRQYPDLGATPSPWAMGRHTVFGLYTTPISRSGIVMKRALDITGAIVGLVLATPIIVLSAIAIKLENRRSPIFYRGTRVGHKGRHFPILKLATMVVDADQRRDELKALNAREGPWFQVDETKDPRITRVGRFLRKTTINEIPQFWNVLVGEMSLVGPRPLAPDEASRFVDYDFAYYRSFDVKPGMTGLWQVKARKDPAFERRIQLDFQYIDSWSIWLDIKILLATPLMLVRAPGR